MDSDLGLFPLNTVLLPGAALRLHIFEDRYKQMMRQCIAEDRPFGVLLDRNGRERGDDSDPVNIGTAAVIRDVTKLSHGRLYIVAHGLRRFRVKELLGTLPFWRAHVSYLNDRLGPADSATRLRESAEDTFKDYLQALLRVSGDELEGLVLPPDEAASSYVIADALQVDLAVKQQLLEAPTVAQRLGLELQLMEREMRRLRASRDEDAEVERKAPFNVKFSLN